MNILMTKSNGDNFFGKIDGIVVSLDKYFELEGKSVDEFEIEDSNGSWCLIYNTKKYIVSFRFGVDPDDGLKMLKPVYGITWERTEDGKKCIGAFKFDVDFAD